MALTQDLSFILLGEDKTASKSMQGVQTTAEKVTEKIGSAFKRVGGAIGGDFGSVITSVGGGIDTIGEKASKLSTKLEGGGAALTGIGLGLLNLGSGEVQATNQLNQAIVSAGDATTDFSEKIDKAVGAAQNYGHSAEDTKGALTVLTEATGSTQKALDQMSIVTDLAAAKHISLQDAASLVAKILGGSGARTLSQYGVHLDGVGSKTEQTQRALEQLAGKLDGQAKASVSSFGGQVDVVKTKVFDWAKTISGPLGSALTAAGPLIAATGVIIDIVRTKQEKAAIATLSQAAASATAGEAEVALTADTVALDAAMDANPIGAVAAAVAGLAAVAAGVGVFGINQLTSATHDYTAALQASNGAIDENVRKTASKALEDDGAYAAASKLGIAHNLVLEATLGDARAQKQLADQLAQVRSSLVNTNDPAFTQARVLNGLTGAAGETATALTKLSNTVDAEGGQFRSQAASIREANDALLTYTQRSNAASAARYAGQAAALGHHAGGGDIMHSQFSVVGENGPEIVALPGGSHVYPNGQGPVTSGGGSQVHITFTGDVYGSPNAYAQNLVTHLIQAAKQGHINGLELLQALGAAV